MRVHNVVLEAHNTGSYYADPVDNIAVIMNFASSMLVRSTIIHNTSMHTVIERNNRY